MKSIYDQETPKPRKVDTPTELELMIRTVRNAVRIPDLNLVHYERKLLKYADPTESKLDNAALLVISYFSGSIISQNKSLGMRITLPLLVTMGAFGYLMPKTATNIFKEIKSQFI